MKEGRGENKVIERHIFVLKILGLILRSMNLDAYHTEKQINRHA